MINTGARERTAKGARDRYTWLLALLQAGLPVAYVRVRVGVGKSRFKFLRMKAQAWLDQEIIDAEEVAAMAERIKRAMSGPADRTSRPVRVRPEA